MTAESALWVTVRRHLAPYGKLVRIESGLTRSGIPDVFYALHIQNRGGRSGWMELKRISAWPKRAMTPINVPHLTKEQVIFAEEMATVLHPVYLLLQVGATYLLLDPIVARAVLERRATQEMLRCSGRVVEDGEFPTRAIVREIFGGR